MAKRVVRDAGLPTAPFFVGDGPEPLEKLPFVGPFFVKPVAEGSSKGVSPRSLVHDPVRLPQVCAEHQERFRQPVLVERFLPGREITVGVVGNGHDAQVVGVMEICFTQQAEASAYTS